MGSRGSGGARNSAPADEFYTLLGTRSKVDATTRMQELLAGEPSKYNKNLLKSIINPNYDLFKRDKFSKNCAICTTATALQLRGYDVEANGRDRDVWRGVPQVFDIDFTDKGNYIMGKNLDYNSNMPKAFPIKANGKETGEYYVYTKGETTGHIQMMPDTAAGAAKAIQDKVKSWGKGSYGELTVSWKTGGAHSVVVYNDKGTAKIYDSQSHKIITDVEKYLSRTHAGMTQMFRLDNAPIKKDVGSYEMKKMFKRRDGKKIELLPLPADRRK